MAKTTNNTQKKKKKATGHFKFIKWFWALFVSGIFFVGLIFLFASWGTFGELPSFEELENPKTNLATQVISSDGKVIGKYYFNDNRTPVGYKDLPENLVKALIATEDERFYNHAGIDARGTVRAFAYLGKKGGASTITQQLAKLLFHKRENSSKIKVILQKVKEWVIAIKLERQYTKDEIMTMYLNIYDFNNNADGIRSASNIYFGKMPKELKTEESAMLVGMLKNSSLYNPRRNPEGVKNRRDVVLRQMYKNDFITAAVKDSLQALPLTINYTPQSHREGIATYFREYLKGFMKSWTKKNPKADGTKFNIYKDGLKIYTTIDSRMQAYAEDAVAQHMEKLQKEFFHQNTPKRNPTAPFLDLEDEQLDRLIYSAMKRSYRWRKMKGEGKSEKQIKDSFYKKRDMTVFSWNGYKDTLLSPIDSIRYYKHFLRTGMMSMEPQTGQVKAWVGGIDYKHFQYDHVKQGKRQVGSTFKPFVYASAIDQLHLSPCDSLPDVQYCIEANKYGNAEPWCPKNSSNKYGGMRTLKNGLANSKNTVTAQLMDKVGPKQVVKLARNLGIESELLEVPSIALGSCDLSVYEMVGAYGAFANQGVYVKPVMVTRIEDKHGTILYEFVPETKDVLSKESAYVTVNLMQGVTESGSGQRLRHTWAGKQPLYKEIITGYPYGFTNPIAGKTGTTQNQSDGWFMGMVPNLVTGVWVGGEDRAVHFKNISYGQGASMALPIWALYMKSCYANDDLGVSKGAFEAPEDLTIRIDCSKEATASGSPLDAIEGGEDTLPTEEEDELEDLF